jgi:hypothetical protein
MMKTRMWWDGQGWVLQTETNITKSRLLRMVEYTKADQARQMGTMQPGPTFDVYAKALAALTPENIRIEQPQGGANKCQFIR